MTKPKALVLTLDPDVREMEELIYSLGYELAAVVQQNRDRPDPQWFLGRGKLAEARDVARTSGASLVIVNADLKPNQIFNVSEFLNSAPGGVDDPRGLQPSRAVAADAGLDLALVADEAAAEGAGSRSGARTRARRARAARGEPEKVEVYDRLRVILEIFTERARSPEARLQVDLAKLRYEMPIVKEYIHLARKGEHPGFLGGGEYEVSYYYEMMNKRIARIRRDLERISQERDVRRKHRRKRGFHLVSLAGYTNAGKSSLLRALSDPARSGEIIVENRYFSTLSTRTRRAESGKREILVTDTVGFIENLPPWVVEAFHSTLEEIALADVIVLAVDASDPLPELERKLRASLGTLWEFDGRFAVERRVAGAGVDDAGAVGRSARASGDAGLTSGLGRADLAHPGLDAKAKTRGPGGLAPILVAFNKVDLVPPDELDAKVTALGVLGLVGSNVVSVSARTREGFDAFYERLYQLLPEYDLFELALPPSPESESFLAWVYANADVLDVSRGNEVHLRFESHAALRLDVEARARACGATPLKEFAHFDRAPDAESAPLDEERDVGGVDGLDGEEAQAADDVADDRGRSREDARGGADSSSGGADSSSGGAASHETKNARESDGRDLDDDGRPGERAHVQRSA